MAVASTVASVGGSLISGSMGGGAASDAADAQTAAANNATAFQQHMFDTTQANLKPYMQTGGYANTALQNLTGIGPRYDNSAYQTAHDAWAAHGGSSSGSGSSSGAYFVHVPTQKDSSSVGTSDRSNYLLSNGNYINPGNNHMFDQAGHDLGFVGVPFQDFSPSVGGAFTPLAGSPGASSLSNNSSASGAEPQLTDFTMSGSENDPLKSPLLKSITMDQASLEKTPGYQFNLRQGLKSTQNAAAARGLGSSGAALKGAANYATGLADSTYQNQFANAVTNQTNQFNRLYSMANSGQNAAAGLGGIGQQTAANIGSNMIGAGNAQAAGINGAAAAYGGGFQGAGYQVGNALQNGGLYGGGGGSYSPSASSYYNPGTFDQTAFNNGLDWSDARLKENIAALGIENGWPVYEFNYIGTPQKYIGVLAQEVAETAPWAVRKIGEYLAVDYSKIGVEFREAA